MIKLSLLSILTGIIVGALFVAARLPVPAPASLPGVLGIAGIYLGAELARWIMGMLR